MNLTNRVFFIVIIMAFVFGVAGCQQDGTAEKAGKKIDQATEKAGKKIEEAGDAINTKVK
jgi:hyperosmotically inducible periplasmic protein